MSQKLHIIAEAGSNHNGDMELAKKLVDIAKRAGADSFKTQFINPESLYLPSYYSPNGVEENPVYEQRMGERLSEEEWLEVAAYAKGEGIDFTASVFDEKGIELLKKIDPPYIKLASTDLTSHFLIEKIIDTKKPMILSTGMASLAEIEGAVTLINRYNALERLVLLHCVSVYPCELENMNLGMIDVLKQNFGVEIGLSDHSGGSEAAIMAIAKGCKWVEKHFTDDKKRKGFDHAHAQNEEEFTGFIKACRRAFKAIKPQEKKLGEAEEITKIRARRSLYAAKDLEKGHIITKDDVLIVRPAAALVANDLESLIGKKLETDIKQHQAYILKGNKAATETKETWHKAANFWQKEMGDKGMV